MAEANATNAEIVATITDASMYLAFLSAAFAFMILASAAFEVAPEF
jgi:hypothetical protein